MPRISSTFRAPTPPCCAGSSRSTASGSSASRRSWCRSRTRQEVRHDRVPAALRSPLPARAPLPRLLSEPGATLDPAWERPRRPPPRGGAGGRHWLAARPHLVRRQATRAPAQKTGRGQPPLPTLQGGPPCYTSRNIATPATGPCGKGTSCSASRSTKKEHSPSCGVCNTCGTHVDVWGREESRPVSHVSPTPSCTPDLCQGDPYAPSRVRPASP